MLFKKEAGVNKRKALTPDEHKNKNGMHRTLGF